MLINAAAKAAENGIDTTDKEAIGSDGTRLKTEVAVLLRDTAREAKEGIAGGASDQRATKLQVQLMVVE